MRGTKYLGDLLPIEKIKESNKGEFIIAPCGSGKSYFAEELIKEYNKCLYLVDTTRLKKGIELELSRKKIYNVNVMCYKTFGKTFNRLADLKGDKLSEYDLIIGDEIHNLYKYYKKYNHDLDLYRAIELLMSEHKDIKKIILTATASYVKAFLYIRNNMLDCYNTHNFINHPDIITYEELYKDYITNYHQIQNILQVNVPEYNLTNKKFLIYTPKIEVMLYLEDVCKGLNMRPISIWSESNPTKKMNKKQKEFADNLLDNGLYSNDYNVLLINDSTETGINIRDDVQYVIIDSTNEVTRTQVRNRVRHDIILITLKSNGKRKEKPRSIKLNDQWLNTPLTADDKKRLCNELALTDSKLRILKWTKVKQELINKGYNIKDTKITINDKQTRVSIINKAE